MGEGNASDITNEHNELTILVLYGKGRLADKKILGPIGGGPLSSAPV